MLNFALTSSLKLQQTLNEKTFFKKNIPPLRSLAMEIAVAPLVTYFSE